MTDIKSCPFCGEKPNTMMVPHLYGTIGQLRDAAVACGACGASGPRNRTIDEASEAWNKRQQNKRMIVFGYTGFKVGYFDMSVEEALDLYMQHEDNIYEKREDAMETLEIIEFDNVLKGYDFYG